MNAARWVRMGCRSIHNTSIASSLTTKDVHRIFLRANAELLCVHPNAALLYDTSVVHPSFKTVEAGDYQRLEFIGDAVLNMVTAEYLFRTYSSIGEPFA
jgi:dsRNA-specific ribonuclease